jgi:hypothetical protein
MNLRPGSFIGRRGVPETLASSAPERLRSSPAKRQLIGMAFLPASLGVTHGREFPSQGQNTHKSTLP